MKIVFMGTPDFAVPALKQLLAHHKVLAVCTQPDRRAGRGHKMQMSPIKTLALSAGVEVLQPETLLVKKSPKDEQTVRQNSDAKQARDYLASLDADVFIVAAYGIILPKAVLTMPRHGCINIHASLLPKYRGASPIHAAIKDGEIRTGITIMHMDTGIDTGDMILQQTLEISPDERIQSLHDRMANLGGECILGALAQLEAGTATRTPQGDAASSYAPMIQKSDAEIQWNWPASRIINLTRAFDPWPGPYTSYNGQQLKIWHIEKSEPTDSEDIDNESISPGTILAVDTTKGLKIRTGDGNAWILEMQTPGGKRMAVRDYLCGNEMRVGEVLG